MCYADTTNANVELGWEVKFGVKEMCEDAWRWQSNNSNGYKVKESKLEEVAITFE